MHHIARRRKLRVCFIERAENPDSSTHTCIHPPRLLCDLIAFATTHTHTQMCVCARVCNSKCRRRCDVACYAVAGSNLAILPEDVLFVVIDVRTMANGYFYGATLSRRRELDVDDVRDRWTVRDFENVFSLFPRARLKFYSIPVCTKDI